jgi:hypothetical protein
MALAGRTTSRPTLPICARPKSTRAASARSSRGSSPRG